MMIIVMIIVMIIMIIMIIMMIIIILHRNVSFQGAKSGAGLQSLLLGRMAKSHVKGVCFHRHRYQPGSLPGRIIVGKHPCHASHRCLVVDLCYSSNLMS